jgi:2,3-bisphosphoglycerate-independent phosphoglycerate mutase
MRRPIPVLLAILDGWGYGQPSATNAVYVADTPNMDKWMAQYPFTTLVAHNGAVGLPEGQMGNSEVGHLNIGAGRTVYQDFTRINLAIERGEFFENQVLKKTIQKVKNREATLHLLGLLSDGGVHSHINHLKALLQLAAAQKLERVAIHAFLDGRDTPPKSGAGYMKELQKVIAACGCGQVATVAGRYWAMDRDNRWKRVERAWQAMVDGRGITAIDPLNAVETAYANGQTDEFVEPVVITDQQGKPVFSVKDGDAIIFFNFRADRARQLTRAFTEKSFDGFVPRYRPKLSDYVTFTQYDKDLELPVVFPPVRLTGILGEEVSRAGYRQLRIAETEKYAHVTYFFNGGREAPFTGEQRVLIPSPQEVATYDLKPEMSAYAVTDELLSRLDMDAPYDLVVLNFANGDMVGHSGRLDAAVKACEAVDSCLGRLIEAVLGKGGIALITADHGNAELMTDPYTKAPYTAHTLNPVPFLLISPAHVGCRLRSGGALKDIAPTVLSLMRLPIPEEMEGQSLIISDEAANAAFEDPL